MDAEKTSEPLRIALIDDDRVLRDGLAMLIDGTPGYRCVGSWSTVESALRASPALAPQVMLLDVQLPGASGPEGVPRLLEHFPGLAILMLTVFEDQDQIFLSLCNGASGYLLKNTPPARILEALAEADQGGAPMSPAIASKVVHLFRKVAPPPVVEHDLTPQEVRALAQFAKGCSYKEAGKELGVSVNTVRNYIRSIYDKLHVHSKSEAVSKALRTGIL
ncbi:MAG: response regulator transcription factor [Acidobacteriota bacterium]